MPRNLTPKKRANTGDWCPAFLASLTEDANVRGACRAAGVSRQSAYERKATDPEFAAAWQSALDDAVDALEKAAVTRARESSDTLLIFLLKCHRPAVYRDKIEVTAKTTLEVVEEIVGDPATNGEAAPGSGGVPPV